MSTRFYSGIFLVLLDPEDGGGMLNFNGQHGVITEKIMIVLLRYKLTRHPDLKLRADKVK
jgi:hypothetical protein